MYFTELWRVHARGDGVVTSVSSNDHASVLADRDFYRMKEDMSNESTSSGILVSKPVAISVSR